MTTDDRIRNEKLQYDINRAAEKMYALSLDKIDNLSISQVKKIYPKQYRVI